MIKKYKNDLILIGVILLLALGLLFIFKLNSKKGDIVNILVNGKITESYPLNQDFKTLIETEGNKHTNLLVIKDGVAFIEKANCPDKICVSHRGISNHGETIVCLPHKLVIEVTNATK